MRIIEIVAADGEVELELDFHYRSEIIDWIDSESKMYSIGTRPRLQLAAFAVTAGEAWKTGEPASVRIGQVTYYLLPE